MSTSLRSWRDGFVSGRVTAEPPLPAREFASGEAASEIPTRLFTNPLTASPLAFTASLPKQKHSCAKSRQLRRLELHWLAVERHIVFKGALSRGF